MGNNDENEIIKLLCLSCKESCEGTYRELFGDLPSLAGAPKTVCKCGGRICLEMTGKYREEKREE